MIVKFFRQGTKSSGNTTAKSVQNYLLNERKNAGTAKLIKGDLDFVNTQIDCCNKADFESTYTSGCLSFAENETIGESEKQALMQSFEEALLPNFSNRSACYWVEHTDKGRLELNFVFAKIDLETGKHLDIYQHERDVKRLNTWKDLQVKKYDLKNPFDIENTKEFRSYELKRDDKSVFADKNKATKEVINEYLKQKIQLGEIKNNDDIKTYIEYIDGDFDNPTGYIVSKQNKTGIVVTDTTNNKNFRLQGAIYAKSFRTNPTSNADRQNENGARKTQEQARKLSERSRSNGESSREYETLYRERAGQLERKYNSERHTQKPTHYIETANKQLDRRHKNNINATNRVSTNSNRNIEQEQSDSGKLRNTNNENIRNLESNSNRNIEQEQSDSGKLRNDNAKSDGEHKRHNNNESRKTNTGIIDKNINLDKRNARKNHETAYNTSIGKKANARFYWRNDNAYKYASLITNVNLTAYKYKVAERLRRSTPPNF